METTVYSPPMLKLETKVKNLIAEWEIKEAHYRRMAETAKSVGAYVEETVNLCKAEGLRVAINDLLNIT